MIPAGWHISEDGGKWTVRESVEVSMAGWACTSLDELIKDLQEIKAQLPEGAEQVDVAVRAEDNYGDPMYSLEVEWVRPATDDEIDEHKRNETRLLERRRAELERELKRLEAE